MNEMGDNVKKIKIIKGPLVDGIRTVSGSIPASLLYLRTDIEYRDAKSKSGYQRIPGKTRINELARDIHEKGIGIPTSILLNIRQSENDENIENKYIRYIDQNKNLKRGFSDDISLDNTLNYWIEFNDDDNEFRFKLLDGQHRYLAYKQLFEQYGTKIYEDTLINFVCFIGANESVELKQFHLVNSKAKSVPTNLSYELLTQRAMDDPDYNMGIVGKGQSWIVEGQRLVDKLSTDSSIWKGLIRHANEGKGDTVVPSTSLIKSLKPVLDNSYFKLLDNEGRIRLLDAYWGSIKNYEQNAFKLTASSKEELSAKDFGILKGVGVVVLHAVLPIIIEVVRIKNLSPFKIDSYTSLIRDVFDRLEGENNMSETVAGSDFWKISSKGGVIGNYSSQSGMKNLISRMEQHIQSLAN